MKPIFLAVKWLLLSFFITILSSCGDGKGDEVGKRPVDENAPVITLVGSSTINLLVGEQYNELGATAKDNQGNDLTVTISGEVDSSAAGTYQISYTASDSSGRSSSAERRVVVEVARPFITTWDTRGNGVTANNQIRIGVQGDGYNYSVKWGDDSSDNNVTGEITHDYATPGVYTIEIIGDFPQLVFIDVSQQSGSLSQEIVFKSDNHKLLTVEQWGNIKWRSMASMFVDAVNLTINASDNPNLAGVTDLSKMFKGTKDIEYSIEAWDVSKVTNMQEMFADSQFNQDISDWDVSNVTNMEGLFAGASEFNQVIDDWDVSKVTNMDYMFSGAVKFNQDIGAWEVDNVTSMVGMFGSNVDYDYAEQIGFENIGETYIPRKGAEAFNQSLADWNVAKVTNMKNMFAGAKAFNQDISDWNVAKVTSMHSMFGEALAFNQDISEWDVENVEDMSFMFMKSAFNQDVSQWNVGKVTAMNRMFSEANAFNQDLGDWNVAQVVNMEFMFAQITLTSANYNALLRGWSSLQVQKGVKFDAGNSRYSGSARFARSSLIDDFDWIITDGGQVN